MYVKNIQLRLEFFKALFYPRLFLLYSNGLHDDISNIALCADNTTPYCKFDSGI